MVVPSQPSPEATSAAWIRSWWASSSAGSSRRRRRGAARQVAEADDRQLGLGRQRLEIVRLGAATGEVGGQIVVRLDEPAEPSRAQVLPAQPQLQRPPAAGALERALVVVELLGLVVWVVTAGAAAVVSPPR